MAQLNYLQEPKNDPNAKSIADAIMPKPQPMKASPVRATLPIPQTPAKAPVQPPGFQQVNYTPPMNVPNISMPDVNVQPLVGQKPNVLPDVTAPDLGIQNYLATRNQGAEKARAVGGRVGELAYSVRNNPVTDATIAGAGLLGKALDVGAKGLKYGVDTGANLLKGVVTGDYTPLPDSPSAERTIASATNAQSASAPATTAAPKATPAQPAATKPAVSAPAKTETTIAQNTQAKPAATGAGVPKPVKPAKAGKPSANPTIQQQAQPQAQAPVDVGADPFESYKARTGIDLSNTSLAPVPSYVQRVDQTQGMDFQNGQRANANGSAVVPVETQEQFNQRWAMVNDFYNSPEGQALVAARQQGDVVEVQRGDKVSYTDLRNGGEKGIQDFIADQAAKDSALAKSPTSPMNNRELNQLDLLKPKLTSETALAEANIREDGATGRTLINEAGANKRHDFSDQELNTIKANVQKDLLSNDPAVVEGAKRKWQTIQSIIPAQYDARTVNNYVDGVPDSQDLVVYNKQTGQVVSPSNTKPNAAVKPSLSQFMAKAKLANPDYSDAELRTIYTEKYGK